MNDQEKKLIWEYFNNIQDGINKINAEAAEDDQNQLDKYRELMVAITTLTTEFHMLTTEIGNLLNGIHKDHKEIKENIAGKTKVILKETDRSKKRWFQFWVKTKRG